MVWSCWLTPAIPTTQAERLAVAAIATARSPRLAELLYLYNIYTYRRQNVLVCAEWRDSPRGGWLRQTRVLVACCGADIYSATLHWTELLAARLARRARTSPIRPPELFLARRACSRRARGPAISVSAAQGAAFSLRGAISTRVPGAVRSRRGSSSVLIAPVGPHRFGELRARVEIGAIGEVGSGSGQPPRGLAGPRVIISYLHGNQHTS